jgi:hypothetical protein
MPADQSAALAEFARACKSAARSVSMYPVTHPSIAAALARVTSAGKRLTAVADVTLAVHPAMIVVEGLAPARTDSAIVELAALLHERLVGELRVTREAQPEDWHALLLILSRAPEDLIQDGESPRPGRPRDGHISTSARLITRKYCGNAPEAMRSPGTASSRSACTASRPAWTKPSCRPSPRRSATPTALASCSRVCRRHRLRPVPGWAQPLRR